MVIPQLLWIRKKFRTSRWRCFCSLIVILIGMWLERFIIIVVSLHRDFLNSSWGMYYPTKLGLDDLHRHHRHVSDCDVVVRPHPADDFDL
jgi:hypothetical protein